jgi:hypothetical protein
LLLIWYGHSSAQLNQAFIFNGKLTDHNFQAIGGALVKNLRTNELSITDTNGFFAIKVVWNDSLFVHAMGHEIKTVQIKLGMDRLIALNSLSVQLKIIDVVSQKDWADFKKEFLADDLPADKINTDGLPAGKINPVPPQYRSNEFQDGPKLGNFIINPISSIAAVLNEKEKQKRKIRKLLRSEEAQEVYWNAVRVDSIREYLPVPDSLIQDFIVYCNSNIDDKYLQSPYYYKELILSLYPKFVEERKRK